MSTVKTNNVQIGQSLTATNNFTWYQPSSPDGTVRLGNGNSGSVTDLVTLTSAGNLGIGTSSPGYKLDVRGVVAGGNGTIVGGISYSSRVEIGAISNHNLGLIANNDTKAVIDTSGNLGLGVTPSTWGTLTAMQCKNAHFGGYINNGYFGANCYYTGSAWNYIGTGTAHRMELGNGQFQWYTAPSGTAGNAISFTQAMTLDASGNLLVGKTTDSQNTAGITCNSNGVVRATVSGDACFYSNRQTSTGFVNRFYYNNVAVGDISTNGTTVTFSGTASSDARLKSDISKIENALTAIDALEFVTFKFSKTGMDSAGVIAQQAETVEAIKPFVISGTTEEDYKAFDYDALLGYMGAAIQELSSQVSDLKAELNELKQKVNA